MKKIIRRKDVQELTSLPKSTLYLYIRLGKFPRPVKLGERSVGWFEDDVIAWMAGLKNF